MFNRFPTITPADFADACKSLELICGGRLDGTSWLSVRWSGEGVLHIKKLYPSQEQRQRHDGEEAGIESTQIDEGSNEDEEECTVSRRSSNGVPGVLVDFSVTLSPTYRVPVLWFSIINLPRDSRQGIDAIYRYVVPSSSEPQLKATGIMGGISTANHPIFDVPAFFIHPCNTQEALQSLSDGYDLSPSGYLSLWLGLVGPSVGLYLPSQVVVSEF